MDDRLLIGMSSLRDGSMSVGVPDEVRHKNKAIFLNRHGVQIEQSVLVALTYEGQDFKRFYSISSEQAGDGMVRESSIVSDALFTNAKNVALFLPIADCIAAVLYDPIRQVVGLAHLGRHNLLQQGGAAVVEYMQSDYGSAPSEVQVWLSPAAGRENYPLHDFDNRSLHEVALEQLTSAGILSSNVQIDLRDTTKDTGLFSHSEYLRGNRSLDGRQAVVAMMRP